jgi:energy-coupling factor transporter ATP-binding protein EcfA2
MDFEQLKDISFGAPAAERDINEGLRDYFVESDSYRKLQRGNKTVILGNRGSGKSALFKMLAYEKRRIGEIVIELSPEDYSYELLTEVMKKEAEGVWAKQGAYSAGWKYLLFAITLKRLIDFNSEYARKYAQKSYVYIRDNLKSVSFNKLDLLISYVKRIEGLKIGDVEVALRTRQLQQLYKLEEIHDLFEEIDVLTGKFSVTIFIDELDKGWDSSEDAKAFISGLFQAALSINQRFRNLRVFMSLRKELYENIPALYEDSQKNIDQFETIEWDEKNLLKLITKRISRNIKSTLPKSDEQIWNEIFSETIEYRGAKSFNYIIDRTLYRPREIIQFCTDIRDSLREDDHIPLNYDVISRTEYKFSDSRTKDIAAEYKFQYPGLLSVFESFRGKQFSLIRNDLEMHCLELICGNYKIDAEAFTWIKECEPDTIISILWEVGFLKAQVVGGVKAKQRSGSSYIGSYQIANLSLSNVQNFQIHQMFRTYLGLKEK